MERSLPAYPWKSLRISHLSKGNNGKYFTEADIENPYYAAVINLLFEATVFENSIADYELLMTAAVICSSAAKGRLLRATCNRPTTDPFVLQHVLGQCRALGDTFHDIVIGL